MGSHRGDPRARRAPEHRAKRREGEVVELKLTGEERDLLVRVVDQYYSSLREEIYKTEGREFKENLKQEEAAIKSLLEKLRG
jgi:hypothetical protein